MLAQYPTRLRSHSSPVHPKRSITKPEISPAPVLRSAFAAVEEASEPEGNNSSSQSSPCAASHTSRKVFRLKRPSSSSSAMEPTFSTDLRAPLRSSISTQTRPPLLPPVLPRRASVRPGSRPSSSSGPLSPVRARVRSASTSVSESQKDSSFFRGLGPIMGAGTNFVLQRRKSRRSSKASSTIPRVQEEDPAVAASASAPQFSTPDRTILQELKHKMQARDAQFETRNGKKHHPYPPDVVPYPRSYERNVVDIDVWDNMWAKDALHGQMTWYVPDRPPGKVLDIGCGSGSWVLDCAVRWKDTHFIGLDIVPLQPDLIQTGSSQLASRITWVQANFLEGLPFQDGEFDFVHVRRIARGVPEDKWDSLLEEIHRVLRPGGVFELFEEELTFPGKPVNKGKTTDVIDLTKSLPLLVSPSVSDDPQTYSSQNSSSSDVVFSFDLNPDLSFNTELTTLSRPHSQPAPQRPKTFESSAFSGSLLTLGLMSPTGVHVSHTRTRARQHLRDTIVERDEQDPLDPLVLGRSEPKAAFDPRDHTLLEYIYNEMHASRFINLEPLALLKNTTSLLFKEVCTHSPVILSYPPRPANIATSTGARADKSNGHGSKISDSAAYSDEHPPPIAFDQIGTGASPYVMFDDDRATRRQPRASPVTPSTSVPASVANSPMPSRPSTPRTPVKPRRELIELADIVLDHRTLNMHLHLRVQEILACAEEMWRFVLGYQEKHLDASNPGSAQELGPDSGRSRGRMKRELHEDLLRLHRREFDAMLTWYRLDMEDHTFLANAVHRQLSWPYVRLPKPPERVEFEELCEKWAKHLSTSKPPTHSDSRTSTSTSTFSGVSIISTPPSEASMESETPRLGLVIPDALPAPTRQCDGPKAAVPYPAPKLHPSKRISRVFRAFVAWK